MLAASVGFSLEADLGRYLGVPILHKRVNKNTYQPILDRVSKRVTSWQARKLSFAGRLTPIQALLSTIPYYTMQTTRIPRGTLEQIERICHNFLCEPNGGERKLSLLAWNKVF